ncbi:GNAT family N-acetyltransferase [Pedobacter rhodius]|uniref:GNAT family N-acetyltransferase n=1 Tax=Pedobacter rhodius TaxID=3004098 RepID=A0ABT4L1D5_9SPHI|nr:GNAT family N-acetyltransferase [Pedobacter sp. SJ11]MCZ4224985.1 GNAT family N-acetyltransferase [Pedobacter sp. SJ11]
MIVITTSSTRKDLEGILALQRRNLSAGLSAEEKENQGFVTVAHGLADLEKMQSYEPNIIAKDGEKVIAYVLAMTEKSKSDIPVLISMFDGFNHIKYKGKAIAEYKYLVVGQVCVDKNYRGQGLFDKCYLEYREYFELDYDFAITEVAIINQRSMNAHKRVGFEEIYTAKDLTGLEWSVVIWDWKK